MKQKIILISILIISLIIGNAGFAQKPIKKARQTAIKAEREMTRTNRDINKVRNLISQEKKRPTAEESISDTIIWEKDKYIPSQGIINDYATLYKTIHGPTQIVKFNDAKSIHQITWDSVSNNFYNRLDKVNAVREGVEIMGWHPYWMRERYQSYKYNLLSTIAFFSYDINPKNGAYTDSEAIKGWRTTGMIDSAHNHGIKVLLTVTNYGEKNNEDFLSNIGAWDNLLDSLKILLNERNAQGIDLNFEGVPKTPEMTKKFTEFVRKLSEEIRSELGNNSLITVQVPPFNNNFFDFVGLHDFVDYFIIQGFDYSLVACNNLPAPVSPLRSINTSCPSIINTFDYCVRKGLNPNKMILGLPAYGTSWNLTGQNINTKAKFENYMTYEDIMSDYDVNYESNYDVLSASSYFVIKKGNTTQLIWYESQTSLDTKLQWAIDHGFHGAAIWALGYDGGQPGIWNSLASNLGKAPLSEITPFDIENGIAYSLVDKIVRYKKTIGYALLFIFCFFILGLFISIFDWRVREAFFSNFSYRAIFSGILIGLSLTILYLLTGGGLELFPLFTGIVIGGVVVYLITKRYISYRDKLP